MLDMRWIRENRKELEQMLQARNNAFSVEDLYSLDEKRREILTSMEEKKARRNEGSKEVGLLKKQGKDAECLMEEMRLLGDAIKGMEEELSRIDSDLESLMLQIPNRPHETVPLGMDESNNPVMHYWGEPRSFDFEPQPHWDLGESLGILDFERGVKLAESRFTVIRGKGALLMRGLTQFMLDLHTREHGFEEIMPPLLVNSATMQGTGQLPKFAEDLYRCSQDDLWLVPTAEVPLTNIYAGEILEEKQLPLHFTAYTPCFRRESGTYGRDVRGILRQHQFDKVEMVKICSPEKSYEELESLTLAAEEVLKRLEIPFRRICLCTGDMGFASSKTYDIEVWIPSQDKYREISSCSNCEDFQARRMNLRFRPEEGGKPRFAHTLNGSGIAVGRCLIALMENYQQEDGSILIPQALVPYVGGMTRIEKPA